MPLKCRGPCPNELPISHPVQRAASVTDKPLFISLTHMCMAYATDVLHLNWIRIGALIGTDLRRIDVNDFLFRMAVFFPALPAFYFVIAAMVGSTALVPFGFTNVVTYALDHGSEG
jgi:hypothetical protein